MDSSRASTFDDYRKQLQMVLEDPNDEAPVAVSFDYLKAITDDFSSERRIGRGGFGEVYKGVLGSDKSIAIKKLYPEQLVDDCKYQAELDSLLRVRHKNIVLQIGYCAETKMQLMPRNGEYVRAEVWERLLCFEYISNGSLGDLIPRLKIFENEDVQDLLGWDTRYAIMEGICRGLAFLHEECKLTHMDLKPENILMDSNMVPKITDFGLSRSRPQDAGNSVIFTQTLTGTLGYMPPEFLLEGKISLKTDIYSLGVIMCQIITGEKVQQGKELLIQRTRGKWMKIFEKSLNDASIKEKYVNQVKQMIDIALKCMDHDRAKRPSSSEILQIFNLNPAERSSSELNRRSSSELNSKCEQAIELLSVHPLQLDFSSPDTKKLNCSSCSLHLTNNMDIPVAFRLLPSSQTLAAHYFWPRSGVVPPKCRYYTLAVIMRPQRNPTFGNDGFFTLESTKARAVLGLRSDNDPEEIFKRATERGFKVHEVKLAFVCAHTELEIGPNLKPELTQRVSCDGRQDMKPGLVLMPAKKYNYSSAYRDACVVHPTEPWIFKNEQHPCSLWYKFVVWNYHKLEKVQFHFAKTDDDDVPYYVDGGLFLVGQPKFVPQKRWILVGVEDTLYYTQDEVGYIYVYSYMAVQNFKGSKTYLVSKIKSFKAHDHGHVILDVHPSRPYVLSSSLILRGDDDWKLKSVDSIKMWDWQNGWDCVRTFNMEEAIARGPHSNPEDQDTFATISVNGAVKVWNIDSPECKYTFTTTRGTPSFYDLFSQDGKQYLIIIKDHTCTIWDCHSGTLVETFKEKNVSAACSHPELPVLITGTEDGRVLVWTSSTFSLVGVLNCDLGTVLCVAGVKGSGRIVINHEHGIAVAEIGHMLGSEKLHESEGSETGDT